MSAHMDRFRAEQRWHVSQLATDSPDSPGDELPAIVVRGGPLELYRPEVCRTRTTYATAEYENAAAHMIAAAPEMLAALEALAADSTASQIMETIGGAANLTARDWIARAIATLRENDTEESPLPDMIGDVLDDLGRALRKIETARAAIAKAKGEV